MFTKEQKLALFTLIGEMVLLGWTLNLSRVPGTKTVSDLLNYTISSLKQMYKDVKKLIEAEEGEDEFGISIAQQNRVAKLTKWKQLLYLLILYLQDKELKALTRAKKSELQAKYNAAVEAAMTPKEMLEKYKAELDAFGEDED